ncbi:16 kDa phloem protein 1 [Linum grandiflorum]
MRERERWLNNQIKITENVRDDSSSSFSVDINKADTSFCLCTFWTLFLVFLLTNSTGFPSGNPHFPLLKSKPHRFKRLQLIRGGVMAIGILEVHVVSAKGLSSTDFLSGMDPYVVVEYRNQERKTSVAREAGGSPAWNEKLSFRVEYPAPHGGDYKLTLKIMDHDTFTVDDFVGIATIQQVKEVLETGVEKGSYELRPCKYSVVAADNSYRGEIKVGLTFTLKAGDGGDGQQFGGWRESTF